MSEFLGVFILITLGLGVVAMSVAALNQSGRGNANFTSIADWLLIVWGWGFAVCFAVYAAGGISEAHLNPAVTVALAARRGFPWSKVLPYSAAQLAGAFVGAALVWANYHSAISSYEHAHHIVRGAANSIPTYSIFATFPASYFHNWTGPFVDQIIGTAFLVCLVFAVIDEYNTPVQSNLAGLLIGFVIVVIGCGIGANAGYAINPARDLGPRLFALIPGYGKIAFPGDYGNVNTYFWIPIVGPLIGGPLGGYVYDFFIRNVLLARGATPDTEVEEEGFISEERSSDVRQQGFIAEERSSEP